MPTYDPDAIRTFANYLYVRANLTIAFYTLAFGLVGGGGLFVALLSLGRGLYDSTTLIVWALLSFAACILGAMWGVQKSYLLKLRAQEALCLLQIEINTGR